MSHSRGIDFGGGHFGGLSCPSGHPLHWKGEHVHGHCEAGWHAVAGHVLLEAVPLQAHWLAILVDLLPPGKIVNSDVEGRFEGKPDFLERPSPL